MLVSSTKKKSNHYVAVEKQFQWHKLVQVKPVKTGYIKQASVMNSSIATATIELSLPKMLTVFKINVRRIKDKQCKTTSSCENRNVRVFISNLGVLENYVNTSNFSVAKLDYLVWFG